MEIYGPFLEEWKDIPNYEGVCSVSNYGNVFTGENKTRSYNNGNGYIFVNLFKNERKYVHRLVAIAFIENPDNKPQVNHKNGIKNDNFLLNLEWATASENGKHAYKNGLNYISDIQKTNTSLAVRGDKCHFSVLNETDIPKIFKLKESGLSNKAIGELFNVHRETIGNIIRKKTWKHLL